MAITPKGFEAVVRNNLLGTWIFTSEVFKQAFQNQKYGRVVTVTANVKRGFPGMVHTGAARAGSKFLQKKICNSEKKKFKSNQNQIVENMTTTLSVEWARPYNVKLNCVAPGVIRTSGSKKY